MEDSEFLSMLNKAFTLLEISITLLVLSVIMIAGINFQVATMESSHMNLTTEKLTRIEQAIKEYYLLKGQLPCPASLLVSETTTSYGNELRSSDLCYGASVSYTNGDLIYGAVPARTLGLSDDYSVDAWKSRIIYVIDKNYGNRSTFASNGGSAIAIKDIAGNLVSNKVIYVLFSQGPNKNGAFKNTTIGTLNSSFADKQNAFNNGFTNHFIKDLKTDTFDDIVYYKEKKDLVFEADTEDLLCNLQDLSDLGSKWSRSSDLLCSSNGRCQQDVEVLANTACDSSYISKNPKAHTSGDYRPARKCLKYGEWSDILYPCVLGCGVSNISSITGGSFTNPGELSSNIDNRALRAEYNEEITVQCTGSKVGYIKLRCESNGNWSFISDTCLLKTGILN